MNHRESHRVPRLSRPACTSKKTNGFARASTLVAAGDADLESLRIGEKTPMHEVQRDADQCWGRNEGC